MSIAEIVTKYPETLEVFMEHGLHCIGCVAAQFENLEQGGIKSASRCIYSYQFNSPCLFQFTEPALYLNLRSPLSRC